MLPCSPPFFMPLDPYLASHSTGAFGSDYAPAHVRQINPKQPVQFTYDSNGFPIPFTGQQPDIAVSALSSLDSSEYGGSLETDYGHEQISEIPLLPVCNLTDQQKERIASSRAAAVARKATKAKERALAMIRQCAV